MNKGLLFILFLVFWGDLAFAQAKPDGFLYLSKGSVKISRGKQDFYYSKVGAKVPLFKLDRIQTAVNTRARVHLLDKKDDINLFSATFLKIDGLNKVSSQFSMPIGKARFRIRKKRGARRRFNLRTANAVIGVKGTDFIVDTGGGETNLMTIEGAVSLANILTPEVEVEVGTNQVSRVQQATRPTTPILAPPKVREAILNKETGKSFKEVKFGKEIRVKKVNKKPKKRKKAPTAKKSKKPAEKKDDKKAVEKKAVEKKAVEKKEPTAESNKKQPPVNQGSANEEKSNTTPATSVGPVPTAPLATPVPDETAPLPEERPPELESEPEDIPVEEFLEEPEEEEFEPELPTLPELEDIDDLIEEVEETKEILIEIIH